MFGKQSWTEVPGGWVLGCCWKMEDMTTILHPEIKINMEMNVVLALASIDILENAFKGH